MGDALEPADLGGGGTFPEIVEEMRVNEDPGLLPMEVPTFSSFSSSFSSQSPC